VGEIVLETKPAKNIDRAQKNQAVVHWLRRNGLGSLPWTEDLHQWRARIALLRQHCPDTEPPWPDLSDPALVSALEQWLLPYLDQVNKRQDLNKMDLKNILSSLLPWPLPKQLDELAPQKIAVPSGSSYTIDYTQSPPVLEVKLQEMFGAKTTPAIVNGKVKLLVHLLSPARRPIQITQDLEGFWNGSYAEVKKEMKGRYPKHPWPDNPWEMPATRLTNRHLRNRGEKPED
jgi:ATP-dependent helicase HrpB